jgi:hypothetical protein
VTVPVDRTNDFTNVKINFSNDINNWYSFPTADIPLGSNFSITITGSYTSNTLVVTLYVANQTAGTVSNTAVDVVVAVAKFVSP